MSGITPVLSRPVPGGRRPLPGLALVPGGAPPAAAVPIGLCPLPGLPLIRFDNLEDNLNSNEWDRE